ncbi:MAG: hypothetical protein MRY49_00660 [Candidatus Pacebacteria bacterium]|nr:hypothetical protein [Candidatus Paceibacterota bacterium]
MSNGMLDKVSVHEAQGVVTDLLQKLGGQNGPGWLTKTKHFLRQELSQTEDGSLSFVPDFGWIPSLKKFLGEGVLNKLQQAGVDSVRKLVCMSEDDLLAINGIGRKTLDQIDESLREKSLFRLGMRPKEVDRALRAPGAQALYCAIFRKTEVLSDLDRQDEFLRGLRNVLKELLYRECHVLCLRFAIGDDEPYSLEEIGRIFKITRERVRQVEAKAIRKLQHPSRSCQLAPPSYCDAGTMTENTAPSEGARPAVEDKI